ncbi:MAG: DUF4349 domain-containing protein [Novosphingobium sp.]
MRKPLLLLTFSSLSLAGCGQAPEPSSVDQLTSTDVKEEAASPAGGKEASPIAVSAASGPKIAYVYDYGFRLAPDRIPEVARKQADLCEKQGPQVCRILEMRQDGGEGHYASGSLSLAVAAPRARAFGAQLVQIAGKADGKQISSSISGEDLSKKMVDTEARLRARTLLRDRLMDVLATRKGKVSELVEAERSVAQVSWLMEMQGRVNFSRVNLTYQSGAPSSGGFMAPVRAAVGNLGSILGAIVAFLIMAAAVLIPLGLVGWGIKIVICWIRSMNSPPANSPSAED